MKKNNNKKKFIFLLDKNNDWIGKYFPKLINKLPKKYEYKITKNPKLVKNKIVFVLSYTKILKQEFINKNIEVLIIHPSKLPLDKGFSPVQNQVLRNQNLIHLSMFKASNKIDSGPICIRDTFYLKGHELSEEIRKKQADAIFKIILKYLNKFPNIKFTKQKGLSNYNKKRNFLDNRLNINKSIKSQFNLLRIVDNENYPAHFKYKNNKYLIKIFREK